MESIYKIYVLEFNNEIIYVGRTKLKHLSYRKAVGYPKISKEIVKESKIKLIEETTDPTREKYWINYFRDKGCCLYNHKGSCSKEYNKKWKEKNKDYYKEYNKKYLEDNKDYYKEYNKKYLEDNKDYYKEYNKKWKEDNREKWNNYMKEYRKKQKQII